MKGPYLVSWVRPGHGHGTHECATWAQAVHMMRRYLKAGFSSSVKAVK